MISQFRLALFLLASTFLLSCSTIGARNAQVEELSLQRWQTLIGRDFGRAYEFETPTYRSIYPVDLYHYRYLDTIDWREANVLDSIRISDDVTAVEVEVIYHYDNGDGFEQLISSNVQERWLLREDQWWFVQGLDR